MGTWSWNVNLPGPPPKPKYCPRCGSEILRKKPSKNPDDIYVKFHKCETKDCEITRVITSIVYLIALFILGLTLYGGVFLILAILLLYLDSILFFNTILKIILIPLHLYYICHPRYKFNNREPKLWKWN